jgi:hypothetical protein
MRLNCRLTQSRVSAAIGLVAGLSLGVGLLASTVPARAEDDSVAPDTQFFRNILEGLGLQSADRQSTINYRERPPLVLPPNRDLPPPMKTDAIANNPAWPKDPDVAARKRAAAEERNRSRSRDDYETEGKPLTPDQLDVRKSDPKGFARAQREAKRSKPGEAGEYKERLSPSELGYTTGGLFKKMFKGKDDEVVRFTGEPTRSDLTEPPPGYQTPSPDQPYGVGKDAPVKPKNDYITRGESR